MIQKFKVGGNHGKRWSVVASMLLAACSGSGDQSAVDVLAPACLPGASNADIIPASVAAPECGSAQKPLTLTYASAQGLQLDLYRPTRSSAALPTVIWIHGGGWRNGSREDVEQANRLVCKGYAVASIDYRLSDVALFPAQIHDVKAAIRFLRANAATYKLDPERFAAFGSSAGGHLALLATTSTGIAELEDLGQGNARTSSAVQAGVSWYGPSDFAQLDAQLAAQSCPPGGIVHSQPDSAESLLLGCTVGDPKCDAAVRKASPLTYVGPDTPPIYLLHGTEDCTVPAAQSDLMKSAMDKARRCAIKRNLVGADHGGVEWQSSPPQVSLAAFLDEALKR